MAVTEYAVATFFVAVALFGIVDAIRTPIIIKRFYRDGDFDDGGKQNLDDVTSARIVDAMYTERFYAGNLQKTEVKQCKAWSINRRNFTLSKATRKRNRSAWSITIINGNYDELSGLILPTVVPEAIAYVGNGEDIAFDHDLQIANRYHITCNNADLIREMLNGDVREFLLQRDAIFIELSGNQLVIKRSWSDDNILDRLQQELQVATEIHEYLAAQPHS